MDKLGKYSDKRILVVGKKSYIGDNFIKYALAKYDCKVDCCDAKNREWEKIDLSKYDVVYDVAGIAHIKETTKNRRLYYDVNRDLAFEIAKRAKESNVKQFVYLSSMSVYGLLEGVIDKNTQVNPNGAYGKSKLEAEKLLGQLRDDNFVVSVMRPPMVYGKGCKGNYQTLRKFALKSSFFPSYKNKRSMIYIDNLSSATWNVIYNSVDGVIFPQNAEYMCTYDMITYVAGTNGKKIYPIRGCYGLIEFIKKHSSMFQKIFGNLMYARELDVPESWIEYKNNLQTIELTEM